MAPWTSMLGSSPIFPGRSGSSSFPSTIRCMCCTPSGTTGQPKCIVHRARRGPAQAPVRAPAALRCAPRRPGVLLHHHRLDDVELAGLGAGLASHRGGVGREPRLPRPRCPVRRGRPGQGNPVRGVGPLYRLAAQGRSVAPPHPPPEHPAHHLLDRLAAVTRRVRLRVRPGQGRRASGLHLGGHRPVRLPGGRRPHRAGVAG